MSVSFAIGLVSGILAVFLVALIKQKVSKKKCEYDERQIAVRGQAFKAGFLTFVICELAVFLIEIFMEKPLEILGPGVLSLFIVLIALTVFIEVAIFKDAYFTPDKPFSKKWFAFMTIFAIAVFLRGFTSDDLWYKVFNYGAGTFFVIILLSILIKMLISKKTEDAEEDEIITSDTMFIEDEIPFYEQPYKETLDIDELPF